MRRMFSALIASAFVAVIAAPVFAADATLTGELVDRACYLKDKKNMGADHKDCGTTCAKKGQPVALVTSDGKLYTITGDLAADNNAKLVPHISHTVEVTGEVTEADGKASIAAKDIKMAKATK
jgi:hypothetical protein